MRSLPRPLVSDATSLAVRQFLQFGVVGATGFLVNVAVVYLLRDAVGLAWAGLIAYFVAATSNWALNRIWTFRDAKRGGLVRQWLMFLAANTLGFVLNYGTYLVLIALVPLCARQPVYAVAAGVVAGLFANFSLSRRLVFR